MPHGAPPGSSKSRNNESITLRNFTCTHIISRVKTNLTLSAEASLIERARRVARQQGATLNDLFRRYLEGLVGKRNQAEVVKQMLETMSRHPGNSGGRKFTRDETYAERLDRFRGGGT